MTLKTISNQGEGPAIQKDIPHLRSAIFDILYHARHFPLAAKVLVGADNAVLHYCCWNHSSGQKANILWNARIWENSGFCISMGRNRDDPSVPFLRTNVCCLRYFRHWLGWPTYWGNAEARQDEMVSFDSSNFLFLHSVLLTSGTIWFLCSNNNRHGHTGQYCCNNSGISSDKDWRWLSHAHSSIGSADFMCWIFAYFWAGVNYRAINDLAFSYVRQ